MSMDGKVAAYSTRTGLATRVPPHYLEHPVLSQQYSAEPVVGTDDQRPAKSWNNDRIRAWATEHGVELPEDATKAQMLAAIDEAASDPVNDGDGENDPVGDGNPAGDPPASTTTDPAGTPPTNQPPA